MPTDAENVSFLGHFGSPVSGPSGPFLTPTGYGAPSPRAYPVEAAVVLPHRFTGSSIAVEDDLQIVSDLGHPPTSVLRRDIVFITRPPQESSDGRAQ